MAEEKVSELLAWLAKRAAPDAGIDYEGGEFNWETLGSRRSRVTLWGSDADFIVEHFHGAGAAALLAALDARRTPTPVTEDMGDWRTAKLPCDVTLPLATIIRAGCTVETLLTGLRARGLSAFPPKADGPGEVTLVIYDLMSELGTSNTFRPGGSEEFQSGVAWMKAKMRERLASAVRGEA